MPARTMNAQKRITDIEESTISQEEDKGFQNYEWPCISFPKGEPCLSQDLDQQGDARYRFPDIALRNVYTQDLRWHLAPHNIRKNICLSWFYLIRLFREVNLCFVKSL